MGPTDFLAYLVMRDVVNPDSFVIDTFLSNEIWYGRQATQMQDSTNVHLLPFNNNLLDNIENTNCRLWFTQVIYYKYIKNYKFYLLFCLFGFVFI